MALEAEFHLLGRLILSVLFFYNGYNHFVNFEGRVGYAQYKDAPFPEVAVIGSGLVLVLGSIGIVAGIFPVISAGAIATFLLVATPMFHDFWNVGEDEKQNEFNHFMKNVGLLGGTLVVLSTAGGTWGYALNVGLF